MEYIKQDEDLDKLIGVIDEMYRDCIRGNAGEITVRIDGNYINKYVKEDLRGKDIKYNYQKTIKDEWEGLVVYNFVDDSKGRLYTEDGESLILDKGEDTSNLEVTYFRPEAINLKNKALYREELMGNISTTLMRGLIDSIVTICNTYGTSVSMEYRDKYISRITKSEIVGYHLFVGNDLYNGFKMSTKEYDKRYINTVGYSGIGSSMGYLVHKDYIQGINVSEEFKIKVLNIKGSKYLTITPSMQIDVDNKLRDYIYITDTQYR